MPLGEKRAPCAPPTRFGNKGSRDCRMENHYPVPRCRLLRPRCARPRRRTAEERDELAPFQPIELHSILHQRGTHLRISYWRAAVRRYSSDVIATRWASVKLSGIAIRPPFGSRACAAMTDSSSDLSRTGVAIASTAKEAAAALKGFSQYSAYVADTGLNSIATRATCGAISLSISSHLPAIVGSVKMKPVTLPPGRRKLAMKPLPIGSATIAKTMGIVRVC